MAITISGENNNDKILASDGVIDSLSSLNISGIATATTFVGNLTGNVTGNVTGDVGGNLTGNVTGNINNTTLLLQTGGYERLRITSGGAIGINVTSPAAQLHVENDNANSSTYYLNTDAAVLIQNKNSNASAKTVLKLEGPTGGGDCALVYGAGSTNMIFADRENERLRIASDGVITGRGELRLTQGTSTVSNGSEIGSLMYTYPSNDNKNAKIVALSNGGSSGADLAFFTRTQGDASNTDGGIEKLRIKSDGKVGIGTDDPSTYRLHLQGTTSALARFERTGGAFAKVDIKAGSSSGNSYLTFSDTDASEVGHLNYEHADNSLRVIVNSNERLRINSDGHVTKPTHCAFKSNMTGQYGSSGSLTTTVANVGILQASEQYDRGNNYDTSTYLFTCPVDGIYMVNVMVSLGNVGSSRHIFVISYTNGGGSTPLSNYYECIDGTTSSYANYSYCEPWYFTQGTTIGVGKNGMSGYDANYQMMWGVHLLG